MGLSKRGQRYTPEEYYRLERAAQFKSDYYRGEIFTVPNTPEEGDVGARGTIQHSLITANLVGEVGQSLKGKPCTVLESNLRLKIKATGLRTYPDASVYCEPPERDDEDSAAETLTNPTVVFEVLSKSTEAYDRGLKAENYRRIESLRAYVLVSQHKPHAEVYERQPDGTWNLREASGPEAVLKIAAIGVELRLEDVYYRVDFNAPDGD
jgi:Uma2 family endonuclease